MEIVPVKDVPADVVSDVDDMPVEDVHVENAAVGTIVAERGAGPSMISRVDLDLVLATHAIVTVFD